MKNTKLSSLANKILMNRYDKLYRTVILRIQKANVSVGVIFIHS